VGQPLPETVGQAERGEAQRGGITEVSSPWGGNADYADLF